MSRAGSTKGFTVIEAIIAFVVVGGLSKGSVNNRVSVPQKGRGQETRGGGLDGLSRIHLDVL